MTGGPVAERYQDAAPALQLISGRWVLAILDALGREGARHSQIISRVPGISEKVLTETLRRLEKNGLVERAVGRGWPSHLVYQRTPQAAALLPALQNLCAWQRRFSERPPADSPEEPAVVSLLDAGGSSCGPLRGPAN